MNENNVSIHSAFYKFVGIADPDELAALLRHHTQGLLGSILIAAEGINGSVAGTETAVLDFEAELSAMPSFNDIVFKHSSCVTAPFKKMKVHRRNKIVQFGVPGVETPSAADNQVTPAEWRKLINQADVVLIDNRNSFEYKLGRFRNAIDPGVTSFRDFPAYVTAHVDEWRAEGKKVAMYCTGGIRCEKTSAWMSSAGIPVYQLHGGILNYFAQMPDADRDWEGECFVFDNRVALDTRLQETSTTVDDVYESDSDQFWRLQRARRLQGDDS